jgi:hypothetical protein
MELKNTIEDKFIHIVFFWLKNPNDENDRKEFKNGCINF